MQKTLFSGSSFKMPKVKYYFLVGLHFNKDRAKYTFSSLAFGHFYLISIAENDKDNELLTQI